MYGNPASRDSIVEQLTLNESQVDRYIEQLAQSGQIVRVSPNHYELNPEHYN